MAQFGYGPKKGFKAGKRDLRGVDPNAKVGGGNGDVVYRPIIGKPISELEPITPKPGPGTPGPKPIEGEKPIEKPKPEMPNMPGKPKPMPGKPSPMPGKPTPGRPIRPIKPKPNPIDIITKRMNDPNGFYNNPRY